MSVEQFIHEFKPIQTKELLLLKKVLIFVRLLENNKSNGRAEIHVENGKLLRLHRFEAERLQ